MNDLYQSHRRKEDVLRNLERTMTAKISERDNQNFSLQQQLANLEQTFNKETTEVNHLRQLCDERTHQQHTLECTLKKRNE